MGVVVVLSGGAYLINTFENDCVVGPPPTGTVCDYAIPKVEWSETYLGTISSGTTYDYQITRTPGANNVFFDATSGSPIILPVFQVTTGP